MRGALDRATTPLLLGTAGALCAFAMLASAGSSADRLAWIGGLAVLAAAAASALLSWPALSEWAWALLGLYAAFVAWTGLSILWSIEPDRSWDYFNRGLVYGAFLVVGLFLGGLGMRVLAFAVAGLVAVVVTWSLAGKMIPALAFDSARIGRLHTPIGYWNALGLLFATGIPVALWIAARREHRVELRAAGVVFLYACTLALLLTYSRGGLFAALVVAALWLVFGSPVLESAAALAVAGVPAVAVGLWSFTRPGLSDDLQSHSVRVRDGAWFALAFVLAGALVAAVAYLAARYEARRPLGPDVRARLGRIGWVGLAVAVLAVGIWFGVASRPRDWISNHTGATHGGDTAHTPGRLTTLSSNSRRVWWHEAWRAFEKRPLSGTGAGSFDLTHRMLRKTRGVTTEPHNVPLQFLSETGIVGFLLFVGMVVVAAVGVIRTRRRLEEPERAAATALALGLVAYLVHSVLDIDWDFVAVTGPAFLVLGALLGAGRKPARRRSPAVPTLVAAAFMLAAVYSLAAPWLAGRNTGAAFDAIDRNKPGKAIADAKRANDLNPLALEPLFAWASGEEVLGNARAARRLYVRAVDRQPLNWRPWYELGRFELDEGRLRASYLYLRQSLKLDPYGPLAVPYYNYVAGQLGLHS